MRELNKWAVIGFDMTGWPEFISTEMTKKDADILCEYLNSDPEEGYEYYETIKLP